MMRPTFLLASALVSVLATGHPAQALYKGTLQRNQPWSLEIDNTASPAVTAITVYYLHRTRRTFRLISVPPGAAVLEILNIPAGARRIIIEVDPTQTTITPIRITQDATTINSDGVEGDYRMVMDVI